MIFRQVLSRLDAGESYLSGRFPERRARSNRRATVEASEETYCFCEVIRNQTNSRLTLNLCTSDVGVKSYDYSKSRWTVTLAYI